MRDFTRADVQVGMYVDIEYLDSLKRGYIKKIYPKGKTPSDVKVELVSGEVGIVYHLVTKEEFKREKFKYYNLFIHARGIVTIADKYTKEILVDKVVHPNRRVVERTAYLFSEEKTALDFLLKRGEDNLAIKRISRKKPLVENFNNLEVDAFHINNQRKISLTKLNEYESKFKQMG